MMRLAATWLAVLAAFAAACDRGAGSAAEAPGARAGAGSASQVVATVPTVPGPELDPTTTLRRIALGSCLDQGKPQPIWGPLRAYAPQLMLMMGDNVYADAETIGGFQDAYTEFAASRGFVALRAETPVLAVWDDHDYGRNDAGAEYPLKRVSQGFLLDFFGVPADSVRRTREGIYDAVVVGPPGQRVQVILLDTRYFRTQLYPLSPGRYRDLDTPDATMLGQAQWAWLAEQLRVPAEVRLLVSSVQVVSNEHPHERWGVFPRERARLLSLIGQTGAGGVVVLSGDRHRGELSRLSGTAAGYPIYELTSSSLNRPAPENEANTTRVGALVNTANFGTVDIVWEGQAHLVLRLHDDRGVVRVETTVALDALQPSAGSTP